MHAHSFDAAPTDEVDEPPTPGVAGDPEDPKVTVEIDAACPAPDLPAAVEVEAAVAAVLADRRGLFVVSIRIVDEREVRQLNRRYRQQDRVTNVLAFPLEIADETGRTLLGDLVICTPRVREEAQRQGKGTGHHFTHLIVHGTLHLLGFDHDAADEREAMEELEIGILDHLGVPDPYRTDGSEP